MGLYSFALFESRHFVEGTMCEHYIWPSFAEIFDRKIAHGTTCIQGETIVFCKAELK